MFKRILLNLKQNIFDELEKSAKFEDVCKGRTGTVLVDDRNKGVPIVRTTTVYNVPAQRFQPIHYKIMAEIGKQIKGAEFNNALIEIYDDTYCKMGYHTDQALDLEPDSYICLFSCYDQKNGAPNNLRKLKIENKDTKERSEVILDHNSCILFNTVTNQQHKHSIVLEGPGSGCRWLGITLRLSKTFVDFEKDKVKIGEKILTLATDVEKKEFFKHKGRENTEKNYVYDVTYTISPSDLMPVGLLRYKAARPSHIATLELLPDSITNEKRKVIDSDHARYRCDKARVISINHVLTGEPINSASSWYMPNFSYKVGDNVSTDFGPNLDNCCQPGIHYFKTHESAVSFCLENKCIQMLEVWPDTPVKVWHELGEHHCTLQKINGQIVQIQTIGSE